MLKSLKRMTSSPSEVSAVADEFIPYLTSQRERFELALSEWVGGPAPLKLEKMIEAARYSLMLPSKRLRPLLCLEACKALTGNDRAALPAAIALEMVHSYSLIHDDLPSMDNDDLRRGKPTNHKVYGEAMAILAGDGLLTLAFEVLATGSTGETRVSDSTRIHWVAELSRAAGMAGMVLGQQWDMEPVREASVQSLEGLHRRKTGALIGAAVAMGAQAAQADAATVNALRNFALDLGLAFQIRDDVLDVIGGEEIGKPLNSDERNQKPTYISVLGLERAKVAADEWYARALKHLGSVKLPFANRLEDLARFVIERKV